MTTTYCENFKVESAVLKDVSGTSHSVSGSFTGSIYEEVCFLRGMETIELYQAQSQLVYVSNYQMKNLKLRDMVKVKKAWLDRDALCL